MRPPQPETRTRDAGEPAPRNANAADPSTRTDQQRQFPQINAISGESRRFCKKTFNASSRPPFAARRDELLTPRRASARALAPLADAATRAKLTRGDADGQEWRRRDEHELARPHSMRRFRCGTALFAFAPVVSRRASPANPARRNFSRRRPRRARSSAHRRLPRRRASGAGEDARSTSITTIVPPSRPRPWRKHGGRPPKWSIADVARRHGQGRRRHRGAVAVPNPGVWFGDGEEARTLARACNEYGGAVCATIPAASARSPPFRCPTPKAACARSNMPSTCSRPTASAL